VMRNEMEEFVSSFFNYVRVENDIVVADTRDRMARDVSGLGLRVVTFMLPQDVAVVCSHVLMTHETGSHTRVSGEDSKGKTVYLFVRRGHPIANLCSILQTDSRGRRFLGSIYVYLSQAEKREDLIPFLPSCSSVPAVQIRQDGTDAPEALFKCVVQGIGEEREKALLVLKGDIPGTMEMIEKGEEYGITPRTAADVLDVLLDGVEPGKESEWLQEHLTPGRLRELMVARGDLPSVAMQISSAADVLGAMRSAMTGTLIEAGILAWAHELKDRPDWDRMLEMKIKAHPLREYILAAIHLFHAEITPDVYVQVGLDPLEKDEFLEIMMNLPELGDFVLRDRHGRDRRNLFQTATSAAVDKAADELDL